MILHNCTCPPEEAKLGPYVRYTIYGRHVGARHVWEAREAYRDFGEQQSLTGTRPKFDHPVYVNGKLANDGTILWMSDTVEFIRELGTKSEPAKPKLTFLQKLSVLLAKVGL